MGRPLRVAVVGAGPAGIYTVDALIKSGAEVSVDLFERMPAPFGLIRYGVAPDHPRIKGIVDALHRVLDKPGVRLFGNIDYGGDVKLDELRQFYDAVVFATGAVTDRPLDIPGVDLAGSHGAADFVSWYDGHPDVARSWPLTARSVAVLGAGNVALDVARVLAKSAEELLVTEIPDNVHAGLAASAVTDVHVFGRRGPAQARFTPLELRELDHSPTVEVIVDPEDIEFDEGSIAAIRASKQVDMVVKTLQEWAIRDVGTRPRRLHLHFFHSPTAILGAGGHVTGLRTERTELTGDGSVRGTGVFHDWDVQAVYRAVGYLSSHLADLPFDHVSGTVPHAQGRVLDMDDALVPARTCRAGSSAARSASSATPRAARRRRSPRCSPTPPPCAPPSTPSPPPSSASSTTAASSSPPGRAGRTSTRTSGPWVPRTAASGSRSSTAPR
ncbi:ferredoxin--NADP+ reductase [Actinokineospora terrae]|uniref:ferredoxin--NADP(+) reductase n=1 Tax=Actinokineospora terrae TaxID=155974 RepID=A0A1H9MUL6_9PSEU|nr:ferredoxin--NADP+ reductase [Actinokineospora terrae]